MSERLIVGLGNPGTRYEKTRHNIGFRVIDRLFETQGVESGVRGRAREFELRLGGRRVLCLKPDTYMNRSGGAVLAAMTRERIAPESLLVVYDDLDLAPGRLRLRAGGSAGGHRGVADVIASIGAQFSRLRIGIGRPPAEVPAEAYVLEPFTAEEQRMLTDTLDRARVACETWVQDGIMTAMNRFNGDDDPQGSKESPPRADGSK